MTSHGDANSPHKLFKNLQKTDEQLTAFNIVVCNSINVLKQSSKLAVSFVVAQLG
jgi:hypothetical protein